MAQSPPTPPFPPPQQQPTQQVSWLYGVALGCTACGLVVYTAPSVVVNQALIVPPRGDAMIDVEVGEEEERGLIFHPEVCWSHDGGGRVLGLYGDGSEEDEEEEGGELMRRASA